MKSELGNKEFLGIKLLEISLNNKILSLKIKWKKTLFFFKINLEKLINNFNVNKKTIKLGTMF